MPANPHLLLERYLAEMALIRSSGANTSETSFYPPLANLLNEIGGGLKPKVSCILQLQNRGAGIPDGGLFTADQLRKRQNTDASDLLTGQLPARGVIEVKAPAENLLDTVTTKQVAKYWEHYGLVLVTNYRSFRLIGRQSNGKPLPLEAFSLAESEKAFWAAAAHPHKTAEELGERFVEYLRRVLLHAAPLVSPQDVARLLASYARDARARIEKGEIPALAGVRTALEQALGLKFEGEKGEHFFRSTLIQTLFYGVFSAWVLWVKHKQIRTPAESASTDFAKELHDAASPYGPAPERFDWRSAAWSLRVPMIRALFEQVATPTRLGPLGLVEVLDWTAAALNRVDAAAFFASFDEGHAVQYFYEPFLEEFDPVLRKELGVWYTPTEIVRYQVARVDTVLREELDIPDGLADSRVVVLDPCCGTGAYLVETLHRIHATLKEKGEDALAAQDLKQAAMERVFGFEILPAPFVIAHLQLGLLLQTLGAPFSDEKSERAGVFLTNALTGWEPPKEPKTRILFPELEEERDAADKVKQQARILVIIGNPPYNGFAGVAVEEERTLSQAYRTVKNVAAPQGQGLNDLYVRFFRMAERRIVEMNQAAGGVICFISNYSWLDGLSFTGMRERFMEVFDGIWLDCLNGDKYKTGKLTPEGTPDPSVFSTDFNKEGIQVGTAIALLVKGKTGFPVVTGQVSGETPDLRLAGDGTAKPAVTKGKTGVAPVVRFRHFWGKAKRTELAAESATFHSDAYSAIGCVPELGLSFLPGAVSSSYTLWPALPDLFPVSFPGVKTSRDDFLVAIDRSDLEKRLTDYFNSELSHEDIAKDYPGVMTDSARFQAKAVREQLLKRGGPLTDKIVRFCYRPFDVRWLYWEPETKLLDEKRSEYFPQVFTANPFLVSQQRPRREWSVSQVIQSLGCIDLMDRSASCFPLLLQPAVQEHDLFSANSATPAGPQPNLTPEAKTYIAALGVDAQELFYHLIAVLHAPAYRTENAGALRQDWPRIPLPGWPEPDSTQACEFRKLLEASAALGRQVAALLDTETPVPGVTCGAIRPALKSVGSLARIDGESLNPDAGDLDLTAGWGHGGKDGVTMPGKGKVKTAKVDGGGAGQGEGNARPATVNREPGTRNPTAVDVYLNDVACWRNIPEPVWEFTIGGYQVIKKWLSYREKPLLGRGLTIAEARYVTEIARRLTALVALQAELDKNYRAVVAEGTA